jgi:hypothetical protein
MKDLIQEGRRIQETFKKTVAKDKINEGFLYNMLNKIETKLDTTGGHLGILAASTLIGASTPLSIPVAVGILTAGMRFGDIMAFFEKYLSNKHYDKDIKPVFDKCISQIVKNTEVQRLLKMLMTLTQQRSANRNTSEYAKIQSEIETIGKKLDGIIQTSVSKTLDDPSMIPLLRKMAANRDSFKGNIRGSGRSSPSKDYSDQELKDWVKRRITFYMTAYPEEYTTLQNDAKEMTESIRLGN